MKFHKDGTLPENGEIFVFGSNMAGRHGKGAALIARNKYKALSNRATGFLSLRSYGIPTKDEKIETLPLMAINAFVVSFLKDATRHSDKEFFVTRIGCGLAGYKDQDIAPMFKGAPDNCSFAEEWRSFLEE